MKNTMRKKTVSIRFCTLLALLMMLGCQEGNSPAQRVQEEQTETNIDSLKEDSIRTYLERMERWEMLHGGMSRWESDK